MFKKKAVVIVLLLSIVLLIASVYCSPNRIAAEADPSGDTGGGTPMPQADPPSTEGTWVPVGFADESVDVESEHKELDSLIFNGNLHVAYVSSSVAPDLTMNNVIRVRAYDGTTWSNVGSNIEFNTGAFINQINLFKMGNNLFMIYATEGLLEIQKFNSSEARWEALGRIEDTLGNYGIANDNTTAYITSIDRNQSIARIYTFDGTTIDTDNAIIYYQNDGYVSEPKATLLDGTLYVGLRAVGSVRILLYKYQNGRLIEIDNDIIAYTYLMTTHREKIYITALTTNALDMKIYTYDGRNWSIINTGLEYEKHHPSMVVKENEVYLFALLVDEQLITYSYSKSKGQFVQEGEAVDGPASSAQAIIYKGSIYTVYQDMDTFEIKVKRKEYKPDYYRGDINQDNRISIADAVAGMKGLAGETPLTDEQKAVGDVNDDGKFTVSDLTKIARYLAGITPTL